MKIVIPAREGSKGLPHKNRILFNSTASIIPSHLKSCVWVLTDDPVVKELSLEQGFNVWDRPKEVSGDQASTKELMLSFIESNGIEDTILMLYLTYPERSWDHAERAIGVYSDLQLKSLLCKKEIDFSPFLILKEEPNNRGSQLFYHDLYRRQDYPKCFEISHFICMFEPGVINKLNNNLYYRETYYFEMDSSIIDVDTKKDLDKLNEIL
jgi:CMP-N-acetylneuraminic acid synthetase